MIKTKKINFPGKQKGFALYYAVLFASIILIMSLSILNVTLKEFLLSSSLKESSVAFYSADSGLECGLYWDIYQASFPTTTPASVYVTNRFNQITCGGGAGISRTIGATCPGLVADPAATAVSNVHYNLNGNYDVCVQVTKTLNADQSITTKIESNGRNFAQGVTSNKDVLRSIRLMY